MSTSENSSGTKFYLINVKLINSKVASACTSNVDIVGHCGVFLVKTETLYFHSASVSTQVYKWVVVNLILEIALR